MKKRVLFLIILFLLFGQQSMSQNQHKIDSLQRLLKSAKHDTVRVEILRQLSDAYLSVNPEKQLDYASQLLALSEEIGYKRGISNADKLMGIYYINKGDYPKGLDFHKKSLKIREEIDWKEGIAASCYFIGHVYGLQGNYPEALKYELRALKISEEIKSKFYLSSIYCEIAKTYNFQNNFPEAMKNARLQLKINQETGNKYGIANSYHSLGDIYNQHHQYADALTNYFTALKLFQDIGNKQGIASNLNNIGDIYDQQKDVEGALKYYLDAAKIEEELGNQFGLAVVYKNIAEAYFELGKYTEAQKDLKKAFDVSKNLGSPYVEKMCYKLQATLDSTQGNFKQAFEHYKLFTAARDSMLNQENSKKILQQQMQYDFDKKEAEAKAEQDKKDALAKKELMVQKIVRNGFIGGFILVVIVAIIIMRQRKKISKEKKISEELLLNILPAEVATELKRTGHCQAKTFSMVTVMFMDFKDFTTVSERVSAELLVDEINSCFSAFDGIIQKYKVEKIKTVGDAYICAGGLPVLNQTHARDIVNAAIEIRKFMMDRKKEKEEKEEFAFEMRIGIHTGPVVAGIVGVKKFQYDIWGDTVNLAARMEQNSDAGKINISGSTYKLVKDKFSCTYRGKIEAKNKGEVEMYFVEIPGSDLSEFREAEL